MERFFFDLVSNPRSEYDFRGRECSSSEHALQMAELIALDLALRSEGEWSGWAVKVRSSDGKHFFSVPVRPIDLVAA